MKIVPQALRIMLAIRWIRQRRPCCRVTNSATSNGSVDGTYNNVN